MYWPFVSGQAMAVHYTSTRDKPLAVCANEALKCERSTDATFMSRLSGKLKTDGRT
jgi:hypothetical protein